MVPSSLVDSLCEARAPGWFRNRPSLGPLEQSLELTACKVLWGNVTQGLVQWQWVNMVLSATAGYLANTQVTTA